MSGYVDCLLLAYSGYKIDKVNKFISEECPDVGTVDKQFNAAISYLGTYLHKNGFSFDYIISFEDEQDLLIEKLKTQKILTIGISTTFCKDYHQIVDTIRVIRKYNSEVKIILGGPFIVQYIREQHRHGEEVYKRFLKMLKADYVIDSYYGEDELVNILCSLKCDGSTNEISNIYYYDYGIKEYIYTNSVQGKFNLENNVVDWNLFSNGVGNAALVRTSNSCPFSCSFCNHPLIAGEYKYITVSAIEKELNTIENLGKVKLVQFVDDTFNVPVNRFKDILRMMIRNRYSFKWYSYIRCQYMDEETVELMKQSGCIGVLLGIESGNNDILKNMNKMVNVESYQKAIELFNKYYINSIALFITGFPGETKESVKDTINFIEKFKPTFFDIKPWYCDTRSPIFKKRKIYQITGCDYKWSHKTMDINMAIKLRNDAYLKINNSIPVFADRHTIVQLLNKGLTSVMIRNLSEKILKNNNWWLLDNITSYT